jgi:hypothetical protein
METFIDILPALGVIIVGLTAGNGLIQFFIHRWDRKHDITTVLVRKLNQNGAGTFMSLRAMKVVLKALREGHINGESERMEKEIDEYFTSCTGNGFFIDEECKK